jgi:hypothetical protein
MRLARDVAAGEPPAPAMEHAGSHPVNVTGKKGGPAQSVRAPAG